MITGNDRKLVLQIQEATKVLEFEQVGALKLRDELKKIREAAQKLLTTYVVFRFETGTENLIQQGDFRTLEGAQEFVVDLRTVENAGERVYGMDTVFYFIKKVM